MKKAIAIMAVMFFALSLMPAYAAPEGRKGASDQALEHASENSVFNRVSDWFATVGKSEEEKDAVLAERRAKRAEKEAEKNAKQAEKAAKQKKEKAEKKVKETKKEAGKAQKGVKEKMGKVKNA